jgi:hypothetical protein
MFRPPEDKSSCSVSSRRPIAWRIGPPVWVAVWVADSWAHGVAFFVDQMVFGKGRWGQRFVWDERLGTTSVRNFNTIRGEIRALGAAAMGAR